MGRHTKETRRKLLRHSSSAYLFADAIKLAMDNNIDVIFLDNFGDPFGRVWHSKLGSTTAIPRRQLEVAGVVSEPTSALALRT